MKQGIDNQPVGKVKWVDRNDLNANDYNPNFVAPPELELLKEISQKLYTPIYVEGLYKAQKSINSHLWIIEDMKREKERDNEFDEQFAETARAVYILNDQRAHLKTLINKYMDSKIIEYKNYETY